MTNLEEQEMEIEALKSIFTEELTEINADPFRFSLFIETENEKQEPISCTLKFGFPPGYPSDEIPHLEVSNMKGVYESKSETIMTEVKQFCNDLLGSQAIFTLVDRVKELLEEHQIRITQLHTASNDQEDGDEEEEEMEYDSEDEERRQQEEDERLMKEADERRKHGTPFTMERFTEWKLQFEKELDAYEKQKQLELKTRTGGKLTGRELFEKGLAQGESEVAA
ncbi:putative RWD domain containing protein [Blattamonas nauphoetae]|uniref:RWD domain containing protein n=1 Tax=Blattamonas nauphoetae TaxID=2049346 RepID=A0ABQ9YK84_9EUKA|nr:putative RWD domain containing protein [Blattamonas nauphoetae]